MSETVKVNEIFSSIQGEGPYVGLKQIFIRFSDCNLSCKYCDTDFRNIEKNKEYTAETLTQELNKFDLDKCHSIVLTGGEPLLETQFLIKFLPNVKTKIIYLETNGTLYDNLEKIIDYVDIISMDYKLSSATGNNSNHDNHERFLNIAKQYGKDIFIKVVFDSNITDEEIKKVCELASKNNVLICIQPVMKNGKILDEVNLLEITDKFLNQYSNIRLIPQIHTFLGLK